MIFFKIDASMHTRGGDACNFDQTTTDHEKQLERLLAAFHINEDLVLKRAADTQPHLRSFLTSVSEDCE